MEGPLLRGCRDWLLFCQANTRQWLTLVLEVWEVCKMCFILPHIQKPKMILVWN